MRFKLTTTVCYNGERNTELSDPATEKSYGFCSDGSDGNGFRPPGEPIHTGQQVSEST